jgi:N-acyl-D-glutamate deacylase
MAQANDIVIANGRVIDPKTGLDAIRNVAIDGNKIVAISEFSLEGDVVIDASGHVVAPGFIDLHAHGQNIGDYTANHSSDCHRQPRRHRRAGFVRIV